jgi:nicotinate phosphoribosyltransferase
MLMGALWTDLYELKMAASYLRRGMAGPATFSLFVRHLPPERGYLVAAGLADCLSFLESFGFTSADLAYLRDVHDFDEPTQKTLAGLQFSGDVWAVPEGHIVFADEPLIEVTAPIAEGQLLETYLLNQMTFQTTIASKAARCVVAAGGRDVVDFAFRRTQSPEAAMSVARVSAMVGFAGTSNVEAARRFGLRAIGTMAHSYVQAFPTERQAFRAFAEDFPESTTFLVDTFDTMDGVRSAIDVIRELGLTARLGIRLDSGDLGELARGGRRLLDGAGLNDVQIVASGGLDEYEITRLLAEGAPIDTFGVGTKMGVSADAPYLDSVYKLVAYGERPVMKLSPAKITAPGAKQVFRRVDGPFDDVIGLRDEPIPPDRKALLVQVMRDGRRVAEGDDLHAANERFRRDLLRLPDSARRIERPTHPLARRSRRLDDLIARTHRSVAPERSHTDAGSLGGP